MPTPIPLLTEAGRAPSTLRPADFNGDMDGRLAWENVNVSEMNGSVIPGINDAVASTTSASAAAIAAATAAAASALTAGAVAWVSGHAYAAYESAISGVDFQAYRALLPVTSATDPFNDPTNWVIIGKAVRKVVAVTGARAIASTDLNVMLMCSGTFALTSATAGALGNGFLCRVKNAGSGIITLPTVTGTAAILSPGAESDFGSDGTNLYATAIVKSTGVMHVRRQVSSTSTGGSLAAGNNVSALATTVANTITGASLASSQVTLPPGKYNVTGWANAYQAGTTSIFAHRASLYNVTDSSTALLGGVTSLLNSGPSGISLFMGQIVITSAKVFQLVQYTTGGFMYESAGLSPGDSNVIPCAEVIFHKTE